MAKRKETLRDLFHRLGANPADVAAAMGRSRSGVYAWLSGESAPKPWIRVELARALGVPDGEVRAALEQTAREARG